jgi:hypothetical protein
VRSGRARRRALGIDPDRRRRRDAPRRAPFNTVTGFPSKRVSSWLFGDGASLLTAASLALNAVNGGITPLDSVLGAAAAERGDGGSVGFRVARRFGARYAAEFSLDYASTPLEFTAKTVDGIEASRSTFVTAWRALFATGPFTSPNVTATTDLHQSGGHQLLTTGVLTVDLVTRGRLIPYVAGGAGILSNRGDAPSATVNGNYTFAVPVGGATAPINETDTVTLRVAQRDHDAVGVFGGGVRYAASPRWGIRGDVRVHAGGGKVDSLIDASPSVANLTPSVFLASTRNPSVQFVNNTSIPAQSTLSGPAITSLRTFTGSGSAIRTNITGGVYVRF